MHPGVNIFVDHDKEGPKPVTNLVHVFVSVFFYSALESGAGWRNKAEGRQPRGLRYVGGGGFITAHGAFNEHSSRCNGKRHPSLNCKAIRMGYKQGGGGTYIFLHK